MPVSACEAAQLLTISSTLVLPLLWSLFAALAIVALKRHLLMTLSTSNQKASQLQWWQFWNSTTRPGGSAADVDLHFINDPSA